MADNMMYYLVQWEDRFMSVIQKKDVIAPKKSSTEFIEGELMQAVYKGKTYEAVISEIHPNKKYLLQQARLPPKHLYDSAKKANSTCPLKRPDPVFPTPYDKTDKVTVSAIPDKTYKVAVSEIPDKTYKVTVSAIPDKTYKVAVSEIPDKTYKVAVSAIPDKTYKVAVSEIPDKAYKVAVSAIPDKIDKTVTATSDKTSEVAVSATPGKNDAEYTDLMNSPSVAAKSITEDRSEGNWKEDYRSLRRKLRGEGKYQKLVEHLDASDVLRVLNTAARSIFREDELTNCSGTVKKQ